MKYAFIQTQTTVFTVSRLCRALEVSSSGYYAWLSRSESLRTLENAYLQHRIKQFHQASRSTYGSPRIHKDLIESGHAISVNRVARLMRKSGVKSKMAKKFIITTESKNTLHPAPDRLQRKFKTEAVDKAWVSDTTFIATRQGWMYLAVVLDLFSRQVIGWSMSNKNDTSLVKDALTMAVWRRGYKRDVIVHSDQGSTYASSAYQQLLREHQLVCSMSRKGECLDNAVAESFFSTLKTELVDHEDYHSHTEARHSLFEYIEVFYNRKRRHSYLGYISPAEFEAKYAS